MRIETEYCEKYRGYIVRIKSEKSEKYEYTKLISLDEATFFNAMRKIFDDAEFAFKQIKDGRS